MSKRIYIVNGSNFTTLAEAAKEFTQVLALTMPWNGNLDAFNDFLRGGFGTPDQGFVLVWRRSDLSKEHLGFEETIRWLEETILKCHPSNVPLLQKRLADAQQRKGETLFDTLVEIIAEHKDIELRLE